MPRSRRSIPHSVPLGAMIFGEDRIFTYVKYFAEKIRPSVLKKLSPLISKITFFFVNDKGKVVGINLLEAILARILTLSLLIRVCFFYCSLIFFIRQNTEDLEKLGLIINRGGTRGGAGGGRVSPLKAALLY